jgi:hypothetical protein
MKQCKWPLAGPRRSPDADPYSRGYLCLHHLPLTRSWNTTSSRPHVVTTSQ